LTNVPPPAEIFVDVASLRNFNKQDRKYYFEIVNTREIKNGIDEHTTASSFKKEKENQKKNLRNAAAAKA